MLHWIKRLLLSRLNRNQMITESENVVASIAKAKVLHKELIRIAHPDKHPNNVEFAQSLTEEINNNRYNYNELVKLEKMVKEKLNI